MIHETWSQKAYLYSCFCEVYFKSYFFSCIDVWIVCFLEGSFKLFQLCGSEGGSYSPLFPLFCQDPIVAGVDFVREATWNTGTKPTVKSNEIWNSWKRRIPNWKLCQYRSKCRSGFLCIQLQYTLRIIETSLFQNDATSWIPMKHALPIFVN